MQLVALGLSGDDALKHIREPGQWIEAIELRRLDQGCDQRPMFASPVGAGEQSVLSSQSNRTHGTLDGVGVQFEAAVG